MAAKLLDGKALALKIKEGLLAEINSLRDKRKNSPRLVSVQVGENPASEVYLKSQRKNAEALGIDYSLEKLDAKASQDDLIKVIDKLNKDASVSGLIVQMPLPQHIDAKAISRYISP